MCLSTCAEVHLDEGLLAEILLRLPAKSVLRFRSVCKEVLLYTRTKVLRADGRQAGFDVELDAVAVSARRPVARFPASLDGGYNQYCSLLASCDGLLLLRQNRQQYLICNPATRQWSDLPRLSPDSGFYFHVPSGEYRLLCHISYGSTGRAPYYCVFSAGADEPRRLSVKATDIEQTIIFMAADQATRARIRSFKNLKPPAVLHGHLHWLEHMEAGLTDQMVAFDTAVETFRRMPPPPVTCKEHSQLLVADGSLMASEPGHLFVDLWVLEGYGGGADTEGTWERRHRVEVPWPIVERPLLVAGGDGGDVVLGHNPGVVAYSLSYRTVRQVVGVDASRDGTRLLPSHHVFGESLVRHGFFDARPHPGLPSFSFS
ncbi:hypothetical protein VPH35_027171 [Triticum aestivum]